MISYDEMFEVAMKSPSIKIMIDEYILCDNVSFETLHNVTSIEELIDLCDVFNIAIEDNKESEENLRILSRPVKIIKNYFRVLLMSHEDEEELNVQRLYSLIECLKNIESDSSNILYEEALYANTLYNKEETPYIFLLSLPMSNYNDIVENILDVKDYDTALNVTFYDGSSKIYPMMRKVISRHSKYFECLFAFTERMLTNDENTMSILEVNINLLFP